MILNYGGVYVTGQTPSTSPLDRGAVFTRYDPENHETYYEYDRFTVMSLDLWPDVSCDGNFGSEDHSAITLDWNREWLIPVNADAWRMICFFNDVAMPGIYTVTVTGSTNIIARYGDTCVRGGESGEVAFPQQGQSDERIDVQAAGPGAATLTVTFTGTGVAEGCTCSTYVNITAWDVGLGMDADYDGDIDAQDDPLEETQGGLTAVGASVLTPLDIAFSAAGTSSGTLTLEALSGGDKIRIRTGNTTNSAAISLPKTWAAGETIPSRIWVQGLSHSDISRDVSLRLTGSLQGVVCEDTVSLTVVQIESETVAELPRNRLRKTIGVGEEVKLTLLPATIGTVTWNISAGTGQLGSSVPVIFTAPSEADTATVTATINGCECETVFEIIAPTGIRMENHEVQTALFGVSQGIAWMGLQYWGTYYVQPDTVNFYNIQLYEGASDVHTNGYFSLFLPSIAKPHDVNGPHVLSSALVEGKGTPGTINDQIGGTIDIYPSSLEGDLYWDIEWSYAIGTEAKKEIAILRQCFHINYVNGTPKLTVTKGLSGYWMLNGTNEAFPVDSQ